jgi:PAS domain S-box-containing protein
LDTCQALVDSFEDSILILLDLDGSILSWNTGAERITGYSPAEAIGRNISLVYSADAQAAGEPARDLAAILHEGRTRFDTWRARKDGTLFPARIRRILLHDGDGMPAGISSLLHDLTEVRMVEEASEERLRMLVEGVEDVAIFMLDTDGRVRSWNAGAEAIKQYSEREILGHHFSVFYTPEDVAVGLPQSLLDRASQRGRAEQEGMRVRKDGSRFHAHVRITALRDRQGMLTGFSKVTRDVSRQHADEEAIRRSQALLAGVVRISEDAIISIDGDQRISLFNDGAAKIFGYPPEAMMGQPLDLLIPPRFRERHRTFLESFRSSADVLRSMNERGEIYGMRRDGTEFPAEASISRFKVGEETVLAVRLRDVTERKQSEEALRRSEGRFANIIQISEDAIITLDESLAITLFNKGAETIFRYSWQEVVGKKIDLLLPGNFAEALHVDASASGQGIIRGQRSDGAQFPAEVSVAKFDMAGEHVLTVRVRDVTERVEHEERIRKSLEEKEVLLKEIHHRVKNNLQVVSSLLSLEAGSPRVAAAKELFLESQNRVASMALIHEKLYQSNDFSNIDFGDYITSLTQILLDSYAMNPSQIQLVLDVDLKMDIHKAVPCGLIVNELLSNSLKHAFPDGRSGLIVLRLNEVDGRRLLHYADNGVGLPDDFDYRKTQSLGFQLVTTLTSQLGGKLRRLPPPGAGFEIDFPASLTDKTRKAIAVEA